jgi:hypothetical protein
MKKETFVKFMDTPLAMHIEEVLSCGFSKLQTESMMLSLYYRIKQKKRDEWPNLDSEELYTDILGSLFDWSGSSERKADWMEFEYWKAFNFEFNHLLEKHQDDFYFDVIITKSIFTYSK